MPLVQGGCHGVQLAKSLIHQENRVAPRSLACSDFGGAFEISTLIEILFGR